MAEMRVWGWLGFRGARQTREVVAAPSKAAAARAAGERDPRRLFCLGETRNAEEVRLATSRPGVVFWTGLDEKDYRADTPEGEKVSGDMQCGHSHQECEQVRAENERLRADSVPVMRGWVTHDDGSASAIERWVRASDGDWISLDSNRRTSGDILLDMPDPPADAYSLVRKALQAQVDADLAQHIAERAGESEGCGHPNHGASDHDCAPFLDTPEGDQP